MRVVSRLFCAMLAASVVVIAALALVELSLAVLAQSHWLIDATGWFDSLSTSTWTAPGVRLALSIMTAAGLVLLLIAWAPRPPVTVPAHSDVDDDVSLTVRRRDLQDRLAARVRDLPYIAGSEATVRSEQIEVVAHSTRGETTEIRESVEAEVRKAAELSGLSSAHRSVRIRKSVSRAA